MNCPNCGATVLKGDQTCKKCGAVLNEASEQYLANEQYRSRFALFLRVWVGGVNGAHLRWLGYDEKAERIRKTFGFSLDNIFSIFNFPKLIMWILGMTCYQTVECILILFGKYRTDAQGHPVRYFPPHK